MKIRWWGLLDDRNCEGGGDLFVFLEEDKENSWIWIFKYTYCLECVLIFIWDLDNK